MNEWYVFSDNGVPVEVVLGRRHAVNRLLQGEFKTTESEKKSISRFLEGTLCDLGSGLHLVGLAKDWVEGTDAVGDRRLTRVIGPGTEV